jgi:hypothetical protein
VQELEVIDVVRRSESIEELRFLAKWIAESMRRSSRNRDIVTHLRIDVLAILTVEPHGPLGHEECLIVLVTSVVRFDKFVREILTISCQLF